PFTIVIKKDKPNENIIKKIIRKNDFINENVFEIRQSNNRIEVFKKDYNNIIIKIDCENYNLGDICYISKGMVLNSDEKNAKGEFSKDDLISTTKNNINSKTYIEGKDIKRYKIENISYLEWNTERVPNKLSRKTFRELYEGEKIMRGRVTDGIFDNSGIVCNDSIVIFKKFCDLRGVNNNSIQNSITKNNKLKREELEQISDNFNIKYILSILNSKFIIFYLNNNRRHRLENYFYPDDFRKLFIPKISIENQKMFMEKVDLIALKNKELQDISNKFTELLKSNFNIEKINIKLENWHDLDFVDFKKELKKIKVDLKGEKEEDWLERFNRLKKQAIEIKEIINKTDKEIDQMVYKLYDLNEDEIKIIEDNNI
ncbi:MAG: TaqI-like C-terminal specificity domain-containing protein, partial [Patescibacteria group bacterium]